MAMNSQSEFAKSEYNSSPMQSSKSNPHSESAKARGVENPIPTDAALIGDTRHALLTAALPKRMGPNFGYGGESPDDSFRCDEGDGAACL